MPRPVKHIRPDLCSASEIQNIINPSGVEKMYNAIYTFSYTAKPNTIYFFWEPMNHERMAEINHVFSYYLQMNIFNYYTCEQVNMTKDAIEDLQTLMGLKDSIVSRYDYESVTKIIRQNIVSLDDKINKDFNLMDTLGYVTFFNQTWYLPMFNSTALVCKKVPTHLHDLSLLSWYEESITPSKSTSCNYEELTTIWDRCASLITKETNQNIQMVPVVENEPVDIPTNELVDLYLSLFLEPACHQEVLLSEVYTNYREKITKIGVTPTTQASFIKQLRTHDQYLIARHARGMVIKNYRIITVGRYVNYINMKENMFSYGHIKLLKQFEHQFAKEFASTPNAREAFIILSITTKIVPTYHSIMFYLANQSTNKAIQMFKTYIECLEEDDIIRHDDLNDHSHELFNKRSELITRMVDYALYYPFSTQTLRNIIDNSNNDTFLNQYSYE